MADPKPAVKMTSAPPGQWTNCAECGCSINKSAAIHVKGQIYVCPDEEQEYRDNHDSDGNPL